MTEIDTSKIKPGDVVTVRAEVIEIWPGALHIKAPTGAKIWIARQYIATHEPAPLKIGDVVWTDTDQHGTIVGLNDQHGTIVGLHDENAWIYVFKTLYVWRKLSELRRVDP